MCNANIFMKITPFIVIVSLVLQKWLFADCSRKYKRSTLQQHSTRKLELSQVEGFESVSREYYLGDTFSGFQHRELGTATRDRSNNYRRPRQRVPFTDDREGLSEEALWDITLVLLTFSFTLVWCAVLSALLQSRYIVHHQRNLAVFELREVFLRASISRHACKGG